VPSGSFTLKRNPDYWDPNANLVDQINYPIVVDNSQAEAQFRAGNIYSDVLATSQDQIVAMKKSLPQTLFLQDASFAPSPSPIMTFGWEAGSQFKDQRLRQALSMLIDRETYIDVLDNRENFRKDGLELPVAINTVIPAGWGDYWLDPKGKDFGENAKYYKVNLDEATKLVRAATGKSGKFSSDMFFPNPPTYGSEYQQSIPILKNMADEGPFNLTTVGVDYATVFSARISGHSRPTGGHDFEGLAVAGVTEFPEVDSWFGNHFMPGGPFYKFEENYPAADDQMYKLLAAQQKEQDRKKRADIVKDFQRYEAAKMHIIPTLGAATTFTMAWNWVGNYGAFEGRGRSGLEEYWLDRTKMQS